MKKLTRKTTRKIQLGAALLAISLLIIGRDIPPPDVSDLAFDLPNIDASSKAYSFFASATNSLNATNCSSQISNYLYGEETETALIEELIALNAETLDHIAQGLKHDTFKTPLASPFWNNTKQIEYDLYKICKILAVKAQYERLEGHLESSTHSCKKLLGLGKTLLQNSDSLTDFYIAVAALHLGLEQISHLILQPDISDAELEQLKSSLGQIASPEEPFLQAIRGEFQSQRLTLLHLPDFIMIEKSRFTRWISKTLLSLYAYQANTTLLKTAELHRLQMQNAQQVFADHIQIDLLEPSPPKLTFAKTLSPNLIGNLFSEIFISVSDRKFYEPRYRIESEISATKTLLALQQYSRTTGNLPEKLSELVPAFLQQIPIDPFDGFPLRYAPQQNIVYSVGKDLIDSGGSREISVEHLDKDCLPAKDFWGKEDYVFSIATEPSLR